MPRKKEICARKPGHKGECRTAAALVDNRQRTAERRERVPRTVSPQDRRRWSRTSRLRRYGLTEESYAQLLASQGNACAMCHQDFGEETPNIDHDHACCPAPPGLQSRSCGGCVRGLLCLKCNTALGYIERYTELAGSYLSAVGGTGFEPVASTVSRWRSTADLTAHV